LEEALVQVDEVEGLFHLHPTPVTDLQRRHAWRSISTMRVGTASAYSRAPVLNRPVVMKTAWAAWSPASSDEGLGLWTTACSKKAGPRCAQGPLGGGGLGTAVARHRLDIASGRGRVAREQGEPGLVDD